MLQTPEPASADVAFAEQRSQATPPRPELKVPGMQGRQKVLPSIPA